MFREDGKSRSYSDLQDDCSKGQQHRAIPSDAQDQQESCSWGLGLEPQSGGQDLGAGSESQIFIPIYEKYLEHKQWHGTTKNLNTYSKDPQKALRAWFVNNGHDFNLKHEKVSLTEFQASLDIPIDDQDFTITCDSNQSKKGALDEVCLIACQLLDECDLLYPSRLSAYDLLERKRKIAEAHKEDDIALDETESPSKRLRPGLIGSTKQGVNTYESLKARWTELNMSILQLKAKLVQFDASKKSPSSSAGLRNKHDSGEEVDPLDEFMSSLSTRRAKPTLDEKIERSRMKAQIAALENEEVDVLSLLKLAEPKHGVDKAVPLKKASE